MIGGTTTPLHHSTVVTDRLQDVPALLDPQGMKLLLGWDFEGLNFSKEYAVVLPFTFKKIGFSSFVFHVSSIF